MDIDARGLGCQEILWIFEFLYYNHTLCPERNFPRVPVCCLVMTWLWVSKLTDLRAGKHFFINLWLLMTWDQSHAKIIPLMTLIPFIFICTTPCHSWKATWIRNLLFLMLGRSCNNFQVVILKHYISLPHLLAFPLWYLCILPGWQNFQKSNGMIHCSMTAVTVMMKVAKVAVGMMMTMIDPGGPSSPSNPSSPSSPSNPFRKHLSNNKL